MKFVKCSQYNLHHVILSSNRSMPRQLSRCYIAIFPARKNLLSTFSMGNYRQDLIFITLGVSRQCTQKNYIYLNHQQTHSVCPFSWQSAMNMHRQCINHLVLKLIFTTTHVLKAKPPNLYRRRKNNKFKLYRWTNCADILKLRS